MTLTRPPGCSANKEDVDLFANCARCVRRLPISPSEASAWACDIRRCSPEEPCHAVGMQPFGADLDDAWSTHARLPRGRASLRPTC